MTVLLALTSSVMLSAADTPKPDVVKLLPKNGDVNGWNVYPDTLQYAKGQDLTNIYNGGYELYTKNGVIDAVQQMYQRKNDTATIVIHRMNSQTEAKSFYKYWKTTVEKQPSLKQLKITSEGFVYTADGAANAYLYRDKYFITVSVYIDSVKGRGASEEFLKSISAGIGKLLRPKK